MSEGDTVSNAFVGAIASIAFAFLPFSTVLGGAVAGYLQGGETGDGVRVGALSGAIAAVPFLFLVLLALFFVPFVPVEAAVIGVAILLFVFAYSVATSALGGALGIYLRDEL